MINFDLLPKDCSDACLVGRIWRPDVNGPSVMKVHAGVLILVGSREQGQYSAEFYTTVKTSYTLPL